MLITPLAFQDDDYAPFLPVPLGPPVAMDLEESVHYSLDDWSDDEWLSSLPNGQGAYRVVTEDGPMVLTLAAFHQLHCLRMFRKDMVSQTTNLGHSHHCLNYLRQSFLCEADTTLEPKEFFTKNSTHYHNYPTRVCRDWTVFYNVMEDNYREWRHHYALNTCKIFPFALYYLSVSKANFLSLALV